MIKFETELFTDSLIDELKILLPIQDEDLWKHWHNRIDVNWHYYKVLAYNGNLIAITARDGKELVAYAIFVVVDDPHHTGHIIAKQDSMYVIYDYRREIGSKFISYCEKIIKSKTDAEEIYQSVLPQKDFSHILLRKGYDLAEMTMVKRIR
ncbi:MAG: N-acetyltransferase [Bacteroidetes bacterium]|nr:MAG: N-acetyltransferase [Bacteroidota bacterium]